MTIENENTIKITVHAKLIAKQGKVELEACIAESKTSYLRAPPKSLFQKCLYLILEKLPKIKKMK